MYYLLQINPEGCQMLKKILILTTLCLAGASVSAQTRVLKWAHVYEPTENYHIQAVQASAEVARLTQGRIQIEVIPQSKAAPEEAFTSKFKTGEIDIAYLGMSHAAKDYPNLAVSGYPFAFQDTEHVRKYLASPFFQELLEGYEKAAGHRMVTAVYYGARHMTSNRMITGPEDIVGLKLRVPGAANYKLFGESLRAKVTPIPFAKVYDALKNGEVDAQENPLPTIFAKKFYEVQKFAFLTAHIHELISITVGQPTWQSLSPADQKILEAALKKAASWVNVQTIANELLLEAELGKLGLKIFRVNRQLYKDAISKATTPSALGINASDYDRLQKLGRKVAAQPATSTDTKKAVAPKKASSSTP
jgi:tripartite ATP-independent transporter DctP family solute receptor